MRRVVSEDGREWYFDSRRHQVGEWYQSQRTEEWFIITSAEEGEAVDEYGDVDYGWMHTMREATLDELAEREREQVEWRALTPEERTERRVSALSAMFPTLDW